jgi:quercetin dioxygenase-like cupin family protein
VTVLVPGDRTEGRFALVEAVEHAGAAHPLHVHSREDELVHVLEGRVRFHLDGAWIERGAGDHLLLPRGSEHAWAVVSGAARLLVLLAPAGLEGAFRELARLTEGPCMYQEAERLVVVAARYGIEITGSALREPRS